VVVEVETAPGSGIISNPAKIRAPAARDTASVAPKPYWYPRVSGTSPIAGEIEFRFR